MLRIVAVLLATTTAVQPVGPNTVFNPLREQSSSDPSPLPHGLLAMLSETTGDRGLAVPASVKALCSMQGSKRFVGPTGDSQVFRGPAVSVQRCDGGRVLAVKENGAEVPDAAIFYFSDRGTLLDVCQPLSWPSGCRRFEQLACGTENVCTQELEH